MRLTLEGTWLNVQKVEHLQLRIDLMKTLLHSFLKVKLYMNLDFSCVM